VGAEEEYVSIKVKLGAWGGAMFCRLRSHMTKRRPLTIPPSALPTAPPSNALPTAARGVGGFKPHSTIFSNSMKRMANDSYVPRTPRGSRQISESNIRKFEATIQQFDNKFTTLMHSLLDSLKASVLYFLFAHLGLTHLFNHTPDSLVSCQHCESQSDPTGSHALCTYRRFFL
jgi:hypothetical protein